jgi:hypothetical protein
MPPMDREPGEREGGDSRARKVGENEALFRSVNEQIESLSQTFSVATDTIRIVCECADRMCVEQLEISVSDYEDVRADPSLFIVLPEHVEDDVERVVGRHDGYWVVSKHEGEPARIARETNPRN